MTSPSLQATQEVDANKPIPLLAQVVGTREIFHLPLCTLKTSIKPASPRSAGRKLAIFTTSFTGLETQESLIQSQVTMLGKDISFWLVTTEKGL